MMPHTAKPHRVLGVSCFFHDAAAVAVEDGRVLFGIQEERLSRRKHDPGLPKLAIAKALETSGWRPQDVDRVVFYENPDLKLQRLHEQIAMFPGDSGYLREQGLPRFLRDKYPVADLLRREIGFDGDIVCAEHHLSHAASSFYTSPFDRSVVVTIDGVGERETAAVFLGEGNRLTRVRSINFPHSLGLFYSVFTQFLGFEVNEGEYKVMGLAPYGEPRFLDRILGEILHLHQDGSFSLNLRYFNFCGTDRHYREALPTYLGLSPRPAGAPMTQAHCDLAASVQRALEAGVTNLVAAAVREQGTTDVCLAGGVALNCTANSRLIRDLGVRIHIHPAAGDAGGALGAALLEVARHEDRLYRAEFTPYLGLRYSDAQIESALNRAGASYRKVPALADEVARRLADGEVIGVLQGRDEWGPRALGARSILADPRRAEMKDHLNAKIKFREEFRPFAPAVLERHYGEYFETLAMPASPHMLFTHTALKPATIGAVVHSDATSRVQTVNPQQNPRFHDVIDAFYRRTGVPVVVNTSFNLKGEPIVSSPEDALKTFSASGIDCLALEDYIVEKEPRAA